MGVDQSDALLKVTTPITPAAPNNKGAPPRLTFSGAVLGSGVLLGIKDSKFLISAKHVIENPELGEHACIMLKHSPGTLSTDGVVIATNKFHATSTIEPFDLCFARFHDTPGMNDDRFVPLKFTTPTTHVTTNRPQQLLAIAGFPASRSKYRKSADFFEHSGCVYWLKAHKKPTSVPGYMNGVHFAIEFDTEVIETEKGVGQGIADPHGCSGGGVWLCTASEAGELLDYRLVGIATDYDRRTKSIRGTYIKHVLEGIAGAHQELGPEISTQLRPPAEPSQTIQSVPKYPGRNELCYCGSREKFKFCHGK